MTVRFAENAPGGLVMTRHQRLQAALRGDALDRVPVSAWMHFGSELLSAQQTAGLHACFQHSFDWDWVKVMADYRFDVPEDVWSFESMSQLVKMQRPGRLSPCFAQQRECLIALTKALGPEVPLFDSGYDPYHMLLRHIGHDQAGHLWQHPSWTLGFLDALTDAICAHLSGLKDLGITGYFHATHAAVPEGEARGMGDEVYQRFVRPFDLRILHAAQGLVRILHAHGSGLQLGRLADYPFEVIHTADRDPKNPSLAQLQQWTGACVMGGIDDAGFSGASRAGLARQMEDALRQTGGRRFMLAPGCVVSPSSSGRSLHFLREYAERGSAVQAKNS